MCVLCAWGADRAKEGLAGLGLRHGAVWRSLDDFVQSFHRSVDFRHRPQTVVLMLPSSPFLAEPSHQPQFEVIVEVNLHLAVRICS